MTSRILVSRLPGQTRVAVLEKGLLTDFFLDLDHAPSDVGAIYAGRVITSRKTATRAIVSTGDASSAGVGEVFVNRQDDGAWPAEGELAMVQITRDSVGRKRRLGTFAPQIEGRYLLHSVAAGKGVALAAPGEIAPALLQALEGLDGSWIVRRKALAEAVDLDNVVEEAESLMKRARSVRDKAAGANVGERLHPPDRGVDAALRHCASDRPAVSYAGRHPAGLDDRSGIVPDRNRSAAARPYDGLDMMVREGVTEAIEDALQRRSDVGGATLTVDPTEALTAIDVDVEPGKLRSSSAQAALLIGILARVRLLNLGGLIAVDLPGKPDRKALNTAARSAASQDWLPLHFELPGRFNVMMMSRRRARVSLLEQMFEPLQMAARESRVEGVALNILAQIGQNPAVRTTRAVKVTAGPVVTGLLQGELSAAVAELETQIGHSLELRTNASPMSGEFPFTLSFD